MISVKAATKLLDKLLSDECYLGILGPTGEMTGGSYARQPIKFEVRDGAAFNLVEVEFPATPNALSIIAGALYDTRTGGQPFWTSPVELYIPQGAILRLPVATIKATVKEAEL